MHVAHHARLDHARAERRRHLVARAEHDQRRRAAEPGRLAQPGQHRPEHGVGALAPAAAAPGRRRTPRRPRPPTRARAGRAAPSRSALEGSTASSPVTRQATHEPGSANTRRGRVARPARAPPATRSSRATCPGSRLQPVSARSRSGSIRAAAAAHSSPARRSHPDQRRPQRLAVGVRGDQAVELRAERERRRSRAPRSRRAARARASRRARRSHSAGSCSAQPGARIGQRRARRRPSPPASRPARAPARRCPASRRRRRRRAARSALLLASPGPRRSSVNVERVGQVVLARDEHRRRRRPSRSTWSMRQQQRPARHVEPLGDLAVGVARRQVRDAVVDGQPALGQRRVDRADATGSSSGARCSTRHQSVTSTTRRPSAVRTRRSTLTGSPSSMPSASATAGGAGSVPELSSTVPGLEPRRRRSAARRRSCARGRWAAPAGA